MMKSPTGSNGGRRLHPAICLLFCVWSGFAVSETPRRVAFWPENRLCQTKARLSFADGVSFLVNLYVGGGSASEWVSVTVHGFSAKQDAGWWVAPTAGIHQRVSVAAIDMPGHGDTITPSGLQKRMSASGNLAAVEAVLRRSAAGSLSAPRPEAPCLPWDGASGEAATNATASPGAAEPAGLGSADLDRIEASEEPEGRRLPKPEVARLETRRKVVLVGRSWGGGVVLRTLSKMAANEAARAHLEAVKCLVLIAPAAPEQLLQQLPDEVRKLPLLLVWSGDDPVVPFQNNAEVLEAFTGYKQTLFFDSVVPEGASPGEQWLGHAPELQRSPEFAEALLSLLNAVDDGTAGDGFQGDGT